MMCKDGTTTASNGGILRRAAAHFRETLYADTGGIDPELPDSSPDADADGVALLMVAPCGAEVTAAVARLKNWKAPGEDGVLAEHV